MKAVSPQASQAYKLLADGQQLTAQDIAKQLGILPHAVYRIAKQLTEVGLVEEVDDYPVKYRAVPAQTALSMYLLAASFNFRREFGLNTQAAVKAGNSPMLSLIKDRPSLLARSDKDVRAVKESIDIIVSGHEIPESMYLAHHQAVAKGAKIRRIVHQKDRRFTAENEIWKKELGAEVRYLPDFSLRLLIYDKRIVYITSFDPENNKAAFGVRFEYPPLAMQMTELFEQNWQKATKL